MTSKGRDWNAYGKWLSRPPTPGVTQGTWVFLPSALGNARGQVKWDSAGGHDDWAIWVPYGNAAGEGALVYVHKADVRIADWQHAATSEEMIELQPQCLATNPEHATMRCVLEAWHGGEHSFGGTGPYMEKVKNDPQVHVHRNDLIANVRDRNDDIMTRMNIALAVLERSSRASVMYLVNDIIVLTQLVMDGTLDAGLMEQLRNLRDHDVHPLDEVKPPFTDEQVLNWKIATPEGVYAGGVWCAETGCSCAAENSEIGIFRESDTDFTLNDLHDAIRNHIEYRAEVDGDGVKSDGE